jgi:hypothetical protein
VKRFLPWLVCAIGLAALVAPATAATYPVSGKWGLSSDSKPGAIDCTGKRIVAFNGNQRTDSGGGVPAYRNRSVAQQSSSSWRIVDVFTTGQINDAHTTYTLQQLDPDRIEMQMQGGTLKLQKCK